MKERIQNKDPNKSRKSHQSFFYKSKPHSPILTDQLKLINKKKQPRVSTSCLEIYPSESKKELRSVGSLEINQAELCIIQESRPVKSTTNNKSKKHITHCLSERNIVFNPSQNKMSKYRKFSSNAELKQDEEQQHKRRLSLAEQRPQIQEKHAKPISKKIQKLSVMAWLILIRKLFVDEFKRRNSNIVKLNLIVNYIHKLERSGLEEFSLLVEPLDYETELTKDQLIATLQQYFTVPKTQLKDAKNTKEQSLNITFLQLNNCIIQYQLKSAASLTAHPKHKSSSSEEHEQAVQTARFQQGTAQEIRRIKKHSQNYKIQSQIMTAPHFQTMDLKQKGKENMKASLNVSGNSYNINSNASSHHNRQSLNPCLSPFAINEPKSIANSRFSIQQQSNQSLVFKKGALHCHGQSLGMLTLEGRSPRELMQSQIYESMQKLGVTAHRNNISFSLEQLETDPHISFQQTVRSFEQILRKIKNIQGHYKPDCFQQGSKCDEKNTEQVNDFLEQLINYRMSLIYDKKSLQDTYSYFVGLSNIGRFKVHNEKIMSALLQSAYMKEYFSALEGIKIDNSPQLLRLVSVHLHHNLRIINISNNDIDDASVVLASISDENVVEILNINNNCISSIHALLKKFMTLKELHCKNNNIKQTTCEQASRHLKIIDLAHNKIHKQNDLAGLIHIKSLSLINLLENPLLQQQNWKSAWLGSLNINLIYEIDNLYVMSAYGHQKDIAFSKQSSHQRKNKNTIDQQVKNSWKEDEYTKKYKSLQNAESKAQISKVTAKYASKQQKQPAKHKISKIKTYLDGKII